MKIKFNQIIILMLVFVSFTFAQFHDNDRRMDECRREQIEELRIWKMTEFLDLTPEQAEKFFPALKKQDKKIHKIFKERKKIIGEIYKKSQNVNYNPSDEDIIKLLDNLQVLENKKKHADRKFIENKLEFLTNQQKVKYIIFDSRFKSHLLNALRQHKPERFKGE